MAQSVTVTAQSRVDLEYRLQYAGHHRVHVQLKYTPVEKDSTDFIYGEPLFGGQPDIMNCLSNIRVSSPALIRTDRASRSVRVFYKGEKPVIIEYDILDSAKTPRDVRSELFRPMIRNDYFYCHGVNLFLNPRFKDTAKNASVSIRWTRRPGFPLFYGFDPENGGRKTAFSTMDSVLYSLITGARDLTVDRFELHGIQNYIVLRGGEQDKHNRQSVRDYFTRFNQAIRLYWNDYSDSCFSLILQPLLYAEHNIGGVAFANGFIGKFKADTIVTPHRIYTISHEIGHHWIGHRLEMDISNQWFGEGFNDYVTFLTLFSSGLLTPVDFETRMNEVFKSHYSSAIRNIPNDSVFANYWKMGDYNKLPYRRGCLFAFYLDNQIRVASNGNRTLRDLLHALFEFRKGKPVKYEIPVEDFIREASRFLPKEQVNAVMDEYIMKGNPIPFRDEMLLPLFRVSDENGIPRIRITDTTQFRTLFTYKNWAP